MDARNRKDVVCRFGLYLVNTALRDSFYSQLATQFAVYKGTTDYEAIEVSSDTTVLQYELCILATPIDNECEYNVQ